MSLSKSKCWYSNNCLHILKRSIDRKVEKGKNQVKLRPCLIQGLGLLIIMPFSTISLAVLLLNKAIHGNHTRQYLKLHNKGKSPHTSVPGAIFTTLDYLSNLRVGSIS